MRPNLLNPLFAPVTALPGVGEKVEKLYRRLFGRGNTPRVFDLVLLL
jgi:ATP-dependent DNA helicase RecG